MNLDFPCSALEFIPGRVKLPDLSDSHTAEVPMTAPDQNVKRKTQDVSSPRLRFAPSPTGITHLGNLRTALFNWLYARQQGGQFILRIEDTDQERRVPGAVERLMDDMRWLGLDWDEGPDVGGPVGPYVQSERLAHYREGAARLLESGAAYYCDCTPQRLARLREEQLARGEMPRYDRHCRARGLGPGPGRVIRFKTPLEGRTTVTDLVRGESTFDNRQLSDPVIMKSDGFPTYHLANVIDDHLMGITHVLRGDEWLSSLPLHVLLYAAFGWQPPIFVHLPLIVDMHGRKLKKRPEELPDVTAEYLAYARLFRVETLRERGYLPEAVLNYLALLGWNPGTEQELFTPQELIAAFRLERISPAPAKFDADRLNWFNRQHLARLDEAALLARGRPFLQAAYDDPRLEDDGWTAALIAAVREEITTLGDLPAATAWAFHDPVQLDDEAWQALRSDPAAPVLAAFREALPEAGRLTLEEANDLLRGLMRRFRKAHGWSGRQVLFPLRAALTGTVHGPHMAAIVALLDAETMRRRLDRALP